MIDTVVCPVCRRALQVPESLRGQLVKCPACEQTFTASEDLEPAPRRFGDEPAQREDEKPEPRPAPRWLDDEDDRPSRRRSRDDDDFIRRPRGRSRYQDDDDDDSDRRPRRRSMPMPGKAQAVAIMTLVGGIIAVLYGLGFSCTCFLLLWPGTYYTLVLGILCIIKGTQLLSPSGRYESAPTATAIMQIINIINLDVINLTLGILNLVFSNDPESRRYYRG